MWFSRCVGVVASQSWKSMSPFPARGKPSHAAALVAGVALLALCSAASAGPDALCTEAYNPVRPGHVTCKDNGCDKEKSQKCNPYDKNGDKYLDTCYCGAVPKKKKKKGVRAQAAGGSIFFDGGSLTIQNVQIANVHHLGDGIDDPADPVVGAVIEVPPLTYAGPAVYSDSEWQLDYHAFVAVPGSQVIITKDGGTCLTAEINELWYLPESNAFSIGLGDPVCDLAMGSPYLDAVNSLTHEPDPELYLWISVWPVNNFVEATNGFTLPFMDVADTASMGVTGTEPAAITVLSSPVAGVPVAGDLPGVTNYTADSGLLEAIELSIPQIVERNGKIYTFAFWMVDDEPMPRGATTLLVGVEADHTALAVYDWRLTGDANDDCSVNVLDLIFVRNRLGTKCPQ